MEWLEPLGNKAGESKRGFIRPIVQSATAEVVAQFIVLIGLIKTMINKMIHGREHRFSVEIFTRSHFIRELFVINWSLIDVDSTIRLNVFSTQTVLSFLFFFLENNSSTLFSLYVIFTTSSRLSRLIDLLCYMLAQQWPGLLGVAISAVTLVISRWSEISPDLFFRGRNGLNLGSRKNRQQITGVIIARWVMLSPVARIRMFISHRVVYHCILIPSIGEDIIEGTNETVIIMRKKRVYNGEIISRSPSANGESGAGSDDDDQSHSETGKNPTHLSGCWIRRILWDGGAWNTSNESAWGQSNPIKFEVKSNVG